MNSGNHAGHTLKEHFENRAPEVKATYAAILKAAKKLGTVKEEAKKTSIHLVRKSAFAGVATRKSALILTLKSDADITSKRIAKREQASAHRWHLEIRLETPELCLRDSLATAHWPLLTAFPRSGVRSSTADTAAPERWSVRGLQSPLRSTATLLLSNYLPTATSCWRR